MNVTGPLVTDDRRLQQLRRLTDVSRALTYALSAEEVLRLTTERAAELLETDRSVLMLTDGDGLLTVRSSFGLSFDVTSRFREPLDEGLVARLQDLLGVEQEKFLGVPLVVNGGVNGILAVGVTGDGQDDEDREWLLSALADQAAVSLEKSRLDEIGRFRERLIGIVSHDLRNPINAILMGSSMVLQRGALDPGDHKVLARVLSSAQRAGRMIADLLDYTQAQLGGGIRVDRRPGNLLAVARQVVDELTANHPSRTIDLVHEGDADGAWDVDRITQVLGNLISNALTYGPAGTPITITLRGEPDHVTLAVHNHGNPIPPDQLRHIFEPMQQLAPNLSSASRSVGLGLYIVENIVTAHGGTVHVESTEAGGTSFRVILPRRTGPPQEAVAL